MILIHHSSDDLHISNSKIASHKGDLLGLYNSWVVPLLDKFNRIDLDQSNAYMDATEGMQFAIMYRSFGLYELCK